MKISRIICTKCDEMGEPISLSDNNPEQAAIELEKAGYHVEGAAAICPDCMGVMSAAVALPHS
jgi:hypothetical protein